MQWSDVTRPPSEKMLRQFAGLLLVIFTGLAAWRAWQGGIDPWVWVLGLVGLGVGSLGLVQPAAVRPIFTTWMIVAFPIGWTVSRLMLAALFYLVFTPVGLIFRLLRRDALHLHRSEAPSYWSVKSRATGARQYFRQF